VDRANVEVVVEEDKNHIRAAHHLYNLSIALLPRAGCLGKDQTYKVADGEEVVHSPDRSMTW